jgi:AraC-like DNA-binding protein
MPVHINNCGYIRRLDKDVTMSRPKGRADYHLLFNASGEIKVNGETLSEGEAYIILPWDRHEYTYVNREGALYYWLHFSGTEVHGLLEGLGIGKGKYVLSESKGEAEEILRRMVKALSEEWYSAENYMVGQLYSLIALLASPNKSRIPFNKAVKLLRDPQNKTAVSELAELYNMSEGHFIRQFKFYTGHTPLEYRAMKRIELAKSLLSGTDMSVSDISESLGFDDPLYFSRVFKKNTGISPREYRKKYV